MTRERTLDLRLDLANLQELFQAPDFDPLAGRLHLESGLDRILNQLRPHPGRSVRATLVLPATERAPDLEPRVRAALRQFSDLRIEQIGHDLASLRREGHATLVRGLIFLAACLLAMRIVGEPRFLHPSFAHFIYEGFVIAGWVGLWHPLDVLLYQRWPRSRERRLYGKLSAMELVFEYKE